MSSSRRKFSPQFKAEAVQFVIESERPIAEITRELQINKSTLGNWVGAWRVANPEPQQAPTPVERHRMNELEDEVRRLRMENEFLKSRGGVNRSLQHLDLRSCDETYPECAGPMRSLNRFCDAQNEMFHRYRFDTRARARFAVAEYIELFDNWKRKRRSTSTAPCDDRNDVLLPPDLGTARDDVLLLTS